jgi:hypothetical protein
VYVQQQQKADVRKILSSSTLMQCIVLKCRNGKYTNDMRKREGEAGRKGGGGVGRGEEGGRGRERGRERERERGKGRGRRWRRGIGRERGRWRRGRRGIVIGRKGEGNGGEGEGEREKERERDRIGFRKMSSILDDNCIEYENYIIQDGHYIISLPSHEHSGLSLLLFVPL